jgi:hypothetical protein
LASEPLPEQLEYVRKEEGKLAEMLDRTIGERLWRKRREEAGDGSDEDLERQLDLAGKSSKELEKMANGVRKLAE